MLPWLGPQVAAAPFGVRVFAYTTSWVLYSLFSQFWIGGVMRLYERMGLLKTKNTRDPALPLWRMLLADVVGYYSWTVGAGLVMAWYNPGPDFWSFEFSWMKCLWYQFPLLMVYDTYFFFGHRFMHINKWVFRHVHAMHHRFDAYLNVTSNSFEHPIDGIIVVGLPLGLIMWWGMWMKNYWIALTPIATVSCVFLYGHSGYELTLDELSHLGLLLINPMLLIQVVASNSTRPMDHEDHHTNPRVNFSAFFTFWDDIYECSSPKRGTLTPPLWIPNLIFYVVLTWYYEWVVWSSPKTFFTLLTLHALTPLSHLVYLALGGAVSRFVTKLSYWDTLRREYWVTYADKGAPGAFEADPSKRYIFCYQPMGVQARGAFYTFAGRGQKSPVSGLADVKVVVGRVLWSVPVMQPFLALYGCCDSSYRTIKGLLTEKTPKSVCITPGGFRETKYLKSYACVLRCRRGFARLSVETGAALVPVIGVGEPFIAGKTAFICHILKFLVPYRPAPLKVVFGEPVVPRKEETPEALHARYCSALMSLAKQHDVPLEIVE